ncbi:MAG: adenosylcobinamide-GDP ribazoletransferase [Pseudomonadota bacterium]
MRLRPSDTSPLWDAAVALALLTRLPLPRLPDAAFAQQARAVWAFPLVGLIVGGVAALAAALGPTPAIGAGLALVVMALMTGALHEDGLADMADGFWGGQTKERRLEIMKDSRIGAYGVLALILVTGLRFAAIAAAGLPALIVAACLSRGAMPALMAWMPHARADGLSRSVGTPGAAPATAAIALSALIALVILGAPALKALLAAALIAGTVAWIAHRKIGGQTGDVLGAVQQLSETAILIVLVA